jgi:hypothetical protein
MVPEMKKPLCFKTKRLPEIRVRLPRRPIAVT